MLDITQNLITLLGFFLISRTLFVSLGKFVLLLNAVRTQVTFRIRFTPEIYALAAGLYLAFHADLIIEFFR